MLNGNPAVWTAIVIVGWVLGYVLSAAANGYGVESPLAYFAIGAGSMLVAVGGAVLVGVEL